MMLARAGLLAAGQVQSERPVTEENIGQVRTLRFRFDLMDGVVLIDNLEGELIANLDYDEFLQLEAIVWELKKKFRDFQDNTQ
jgi:hypothetical protein